jgi:hypothetical protein
MDLARKLGIGIVMIVPAFVFGGVLWALVKSWLAVLGLEILMVFIYAWIVSGRRRVRELKAEA